MSEERRVIHVRIPKPLLKRIDLLAVHMELDRARTVERILQEGLPEVEARLALEQ